METEHAECSPQVSSRVHDTDLPVIVRTRRAMALRGGTLSLAQGIVHWPPPPQAMEYAAELLQDPQAHALHSYGPDEGLPALREALRKKLEEQNGLVKHNVIVTSGANQAFVNILLSLVDVNDRIVLFKPYYFNFHMAIQMTGSAPNLVYGQCDAATLHPDLEWLAMTLATDDPPKLVVLVNPCNPTGVLMSREELERASSMCSKARAWLVIDNTYEDFMYNGAQHYCPSGQHILHMFSFSKAYGLMGWRVGYVAYPDLDGTDGIGSQLLKTQDTIAICAPQLSQHIALKCLQTGADYVAEHVKALAANRESLQDALSPLGHLGTGVAGGEGGIYFWAKLPAGCEDDVAVVEWLVKAAGICVIPGSACGAPGYIRCAFANMPPATYTEAAHRLKVGLQKLKDEGMQALQAEIA